MEQEISEIYIDPRTFASSSVPSIGSLLNCSQCNFMCSSWREFILHAKLHDGVEMNPRNECRFRRLCRSNPLKYKKQNADGLALLTREGFPERPPIQIESSYEYDHASAFSLEKSTVQEIPVNDGDVKQDSIQQYQSTFYSQRGLQEIFQCVICKTPFPRRSELTKHMKLEHNQKIIFECQLCSKQLQYFASCRMHMVKQHGKVFEKYQMLLKMENVIIYYIGVDKMINGVSKTKLESIDCATIATPTVTKQAPVELIDLTDDKKPPPTKMYKCGYLGCKKDYESAYYLKMIHQRKHTGDYPFKCDWEGCTWRFVSKADPANHYKSQIKNKPHKCRLCKDSFPSTDHLTSHMNDNHNLDL